MTISELCHTDTPALAPAAAKLNIVIGIPSVGRRDILATTLSHIAFQTRLPDEIIISVASKEDFDQASIAQAPCPVRTLLSERGSCSQRNTILDSIPNADIVLFLDDDFLMAPTYLEETEKVFRYQPDVDICTGTVIADGIIGPGIPVAEGIRILETLQPEAQDDGLAICAVYNGYGCNMAVRTSAIRIGNLRFDENLPLYGWLEDVDFSRIAARYGRVVISQKIRGVHLGTKMGRTSGMRLGYSQIANPIYLMRKHTMSVGRACSQMARNLAANAVKVWRPEPWVDRRGRLKGNLYGLFDLVTGRLSPKNIERLD